MAYPILPLPLDARVSVTKNYKHEPLVTTFIEGQITEYIPKNRRNITNYSINLNTYIDNLEEIINFLDDRQGFKPFIFSQDNKTYICTEYSVTFGSDINKGTIQMNLQRVTNDG